MRYRRLRRARGKTDILKRRIRADPPLQKLRRKLYDALAAEFHSRKIGVKNEDKK